MSVTEVDSIAGAEAVDWMEVEMLWVEMDLFSAGAWRWLQLWLSGARLISEGRLPLRRCGDSVCVSGAACVLER